MVSKRVLESYKKLLNYASRSTNQMFEEILVNPEHQQRVKLIAKKYTRGTSVAWEDAFQTAQIKLLEAVKAGKFRQGGIKNFYHWAMVVARYEIIDFVRKESRRSCQSLDERIPGTDVSVLDTIADEFNLSDTVVRADLVSRVRQAVKKLSLCYPERGYLQLWQGLVQGKKQIQLAADLQVSQGEISRRQKELVGRLAQELGLLEPEVVKQEQQRSSKPKAVRKRSNKQW